jgi:signal transduction histidine kinase
LINLLRNSTKFTFKGFIMLNTFRSRLALLKDEQLIGHQDAVTFDVYDTGIGISDANKKNIFQLFGKVMQTDTSINKEGIGLGLYITKTIAEQLGGIITFDS